MFTMFKFTCHSFCFDRFLITFPIERNLLSSINSDRTYPLIFVFKFKLENYFLFFSQIELVRTLLITYV